MTDSFAPALIRIACRLVTYARHRRIGVVADLYGFFSGAKRQDTNECPDPKDGNQVQTEAPI